MISQQTQDKAYGVFKSLASRAKQYAMNLSEIEVKVEEATNNEAWGPTGTQMSEITKECYDSESFKQIMGVIARRLQDKEEDWRHVYKSLLLLEYMAKHGPQKVVDELVSNVNIIEKLQQFQYKDNNGRDWGLNVRQRAKEVAGLVGNSERIRAERAKAKANESKYTGVSSDDMRAGGGFRNKAAYSSGGSYSGFGNSGGGLGSSSARIDDDDDSQLHIKSESPARSSQSVVDAVTETQKRIAALKHDSMPASEDAPLAPETVRPRAAAASPARHREAPPPEAKAPKRLSEFRVNPNIAAAFGGPGARLPSLAPSGGNLLSAPPAAAAAPAAASPGDLLGGLQNPAPASGNSTHGAEADVWSSFADSRNTGSSTAQSITAGGFDAPAFADADPFAAPAPSQQQHADDPFTSMMAGRPHTQAAKPAPASADPFAAMSQPARPAPSQISDPFAVVSLSGPSGPSLAPAKPPAPPSSDPFMSLGGPVPAAQSPMAASASPKGSPLAGSNFGNFTGASGTPKSAMIGQPLPEGMFSMPMQPPPQQQQQQRSGLGGGQQMPMGGPGFGAQFSGSPHATNSPQARPGYGMQPQQQQPGAFGAPFGQQQPALQQQQGFQQGFGGQPQQFGQQQAFGQPAYQAQDPFSSGPSISVGGADFSSSGPQHVSLPAAPPKKDPFAGLSGF